eukprot:scaffold171073_cov22-Tisochrysis_lutea.AAC.1
MVRATAAAQNEQADGEQAHGQHTTAAHGEQEMVVKHMVSTQQPSVIRRQPLKPERASAFKVRACISLQNQSMHQPLKLVQK